MIRTTMTLVVALSVFGTLGPELPATAASTGESAGQTGRIVSEKPTSTTPAVMDGTVRSIAKVGGLIVIAGDFTTVRDPGSSVDIARHNVAAFDAGTGKVDKDFAPNPDGTVYKVLPASDGRSVYLGGDFHRLAYAKKKAKGVSRLVRLRVSDGSLVRTFSPGDWDGQIRDLELTGNRLWVAGKFTHVQGKQQRALATLNAKTGAYDKFFRETFAGVLRSGAAAVASDVTDVLSITTDPRNRRLVAGGNFTSVSGQARSQIALFGIAKSRSKAKLGSWSTQLFESGCHPKFDTYLSEVSFSPDGSYFAVATSGGYGGSNSSLGVSGCDLVARFDPAASGPDVRPAWTAYTGGDSTWSVEVTDDVIYVGGHQRWQNNPGGDNYPAAGSVERTGIAALDPLNGLPYAWNPTRLPRGVGVRDMLATKQGLYVGSDTTTFAGKERPRLAFVPVAGGAKVRTYSSPRLAGTVVTVKQGAISAQLRSFDGEKLRRAPRTSKLLESALAGATGAVRINNGLYVAHTNGSFTRRKIYDDGSLGAVHSVNAADALSWQAGWHQTDVPHLTSLFYLDGQLYFTLSGKNVLFKRGFEASDDVVGQLRTSSPAVDGITFSDIRGAFVSGGTFYFAKSSGKLFAARWKDGAPVAGTAKQVEGAGTGWASKVMYVG